MCPSTIIKGKRVHKVSLNDIELYKVFGDRIVKSSMNSCGKMDTMWVTCSMDYDSEVIMIKVPPIQCPYIGTKKELKINNTMGKRVVDMLCDDVQHDEAKEVDFMGAHKGASISVERNKDEDKLGFRLGRKTNIEQQFLNGMRCINLTVQFVARKKKIVDKSYTVMHFFEEYTIFTSLVKFRSLLIGDANYKNFLSSMTVESCTSQHCMDMLEAMIPGIFEVKGASRRMMCNKNMRSHILNKMHSNRVVPYEVGTPSISLVNVDSTIHKSRKKLAEWMETTKEISMHTITSELVTSLSVAHHSKKKTYYFKDEYGTLTGVHNINHGDTQKEKLDIAVKLSIIYKLYGVVPCHIILQHLSNITSSFVCNDQDHYKCTSKVVIGNCAHMTDDKMVCVRCKSVPKNMAMKANLSYWGSNRKYLYAHVTCESVYNPNFHEIAGAMNSVESEVALLTNGMHDKSFKSREMLCSITSKVVDSLNSSTVAVYGISPLSYKIVPIALMNTSNVDNKDVEAFTKEITISEGV